MIPEHDFSEIVLLKIVRWSSGLILLLPLLIIETAFFPFTFPKIIFYRILVEITFGSALLLWIRYPGNYRPHYKNPVFLAFSAYLVILFLTCLTSVDRNRSFWSTQDRMTGFLTYFHHWMLLAALPSVFKEWKDWATLLKIAILAGLISSSMGVAEMMGKIHMADHTHYGIIATQGNPIALSLYSCMLVFLALLMILKEKSGFWKLICFSSILLSLLTSCLSGSRGALLALLAGCLVVLLLQLFLFSSRKIRFMVFLGIGLSLCLLYGAKIWLKTPSIERWVYQKLPEGVVRLIYYTHNTDRMTLWTIGMKGFFEKPLTGWGMENYNVVFNRYFEPSLLGEHLYESWYDRSHNVFIDLLCLNGVGGFLAVISFWIVLFFLLIKRLKSESSSQTRFVWMIWIGFYSFYFFQGLTNLDMPSSMIMFYMTLGITMSLAQEQRNPSKDKKAISIQNAHHLAGRRSYVDTLCVALMVYLSISFLNWKPFKKNALGFEAAVTIRNHYAKGLELFKRALNTNCFTNFEVRIELAKAVLLNLQNPSLSVQDKKEGLLLALTESDKNIQDHPLDIKSYIASSLLRRTLHTLNPTYLDQAESLMQKALTLAPKRTEIYSELSEIYQLKNDPNKAILWKLRAELLQKN